jgi:hypothetical protein
MERGVTQWMECRILTSVEAEWPVIAAALF